MLRKYSVSIRGHQTSYSLEIEFYTELVAIAKIQNMPLAKLITKIDAARPQKTNLSSALRLFVLQQLKTKSINALPETH